jgi:hypothetical protein
MLKLDSFKIIADRVDPPGKLVSIDEVSLAGLEGNVSRDVAGRPSASGLILGAPAVPAPVSAAGGAAQGGPTSGTASNAGATTQPASGQPSSGELAASTQPAGMATTSVAGVIVSQNAAPGGETTVTISVPTSQPGNNLTAIANKLPLPLVELRKLDIGVKRFTFTDYSRPAAAPVSIADLTLTNPAPIKLLGDDPASCPSIKLDLNCAVDPNPPPSTSTPPRSPMTATSKSPWPSTASRAPDCCR